MKDNFPLVSIILPTFNGERYLRQSISSCLEQAYKNIELIIVNDCSADSSSAIIKEFANQDCRIIPIINDTNLKLPKSLNIGHRIAKGSLMTWHSDDNFYEKDAIKKMVECFHNNPLADIVYSDFNVIDENGALLNPGFARESTMLYKYNCIGACFLYKKEVFLNLNGYDESLFLAEDYDFWIKAYEKFTFVKLDKILYNYRYHPKSLTNLQTTGIKNVTIETKLKRISILEKKSTSKQIAALYKEIILYNKSRIITLNYFTKLLFLSPVMFFKVCIRYILQFRL